MCKIIFQVNGFHYDIEKHMYSEKFQFAENKLFCDRSHGRKASRTDKDTNSSLLMLQGEHPR